jgi:hypothetical protein
VIDDDGRHHDRKEQIGGEGGEELDDRLNPPREPRPEADPHANGHPHERRQRDQDDDACECRKAEQDDVQDLAQADFAMNKAADCVKRECRPREQNHIPEIVEPARRAKGDLPALRHARQLVARVTDEAGETLRGTLHEADQSCPLHHDEKPGRVDFVPANLFEFEPLRPGE